MPQVVIDSGRTPPLLLAPPGNAVLLHISYRPSIRTANATAAAVVAGLQCLVVVLL